jgi:hypothetical protein
MKAISTKKKSKIPYSKVVMTLTIDLSTLEKLIQSEKNINDKVLINKFKRVYDKRKKEQLDYFKRYVERRMPGSNN